MLEQINTQTTKQTKVTVINLPIVVYSVFAYQIVAFYVFLIFVLLYTVFQIQRRRSVLEDDD